MRRKPRHRFRMLDVAEWGPHRAEYEAQKAVAETRMAEFDELPPNFRALVNTIGLGARLTSNYRLYREGVSSAAVAERIKSEIALKRIEESAEAFET